MLEAPLKQNVRYINFQVFPASYTITKTGQTFGDEFKAICTDTHLIVFSDKDIVQYVSEIVSFEKISFKHFIVQTDILGEIVVRREDNCGCGNRLRGFHPYQGIPQIAQYPFLKGT